MRRKVTILKLGAVSRELRAASALREPLCTPCLRGYPELDEGFTAETRRARRNTEA
jgi:hypothetical protein